ncbi:MAG TPA: amylo-alpha-1,6-glucosidase [Polyangiaceae bacterium]
MNDVTVSRTGFRRGEDPEALLEREWLVTNGLGGYACGSLAGVLTRRFHGLLVAALAPPLGRTLLVNQLREELVVGDAVHSLCGQEPMNGEVALPTLDHFTLEHGLPVWRYRFGDVSLEKRVFMPHLSNTTLVVYRLLSAPCAVRLRLSPAFRVRRHEGELWREISADARGNPEFPYELSETPHGLEIAAGDSFPDIRLAVRAPSEVRFTREPQVAELLYRIERNRGYDFHGPVFFPGHYELNLSAGDSAAVILSTSEWNELAGLVPDALLEAELERRGQLLRAAHPAVRDGMGAELVLAADQFVIIPRLTTETTHRDLRSVIAGYHWFTDWGRDTMISLEGLTLLTGRHRAARDILLTFADHTRHGLIPNLFPEGGTEGLYHTADATLWFFHALSRYEQLTGDDATRRALMPTLLEIAAAHFRGTDFGIGVDADDGLLRQGAEGYQLTWMDAKVDGWVVTPRRGKAVELNALFYNALRLLEAWLIRDDDAERAEQYARAATRLESAFNERFWYDAGGYLYDVVDGPTEAPAGPDDPAFRPNQLFAIALPHAVLRRERWKPVVDQAGQRLLTPAGLRSLAPGHADYKPRYDGDLRARDAAYHQGTVWGWLIGPFVDAWLKVYPSDRHGARELVRRFDTQLGEACIGSISEIFDAEAPFHPRGCVAQAWSVAESLRGLVATSRR